MHSRLLFKQRQLSSLCSHPPAITVPQGFHLTSADHTLIYSAHANILHLLLQALGAVRHLFADNFAATVHVMWTHMWQCTCT